MIISFEEIKISGTKSGKCICGKRHKYTKWFGQTLNPYNKNCKGEPKTRVQIEEEIAAKKNDWLNDPITCNHKSYWEWTKAQQEEYDKRGEAIVELECGKMAKIKDYRY